MVDVRLYVEMGSLQEPKHAMTWMLTIMTDVHLYVLSSLSIHALTNQAYAGIMALLSAEIEESKVLKNVMMGTLWMEMDVHQLVKFKQRQPRLMETWLL